MHRRMSVMRFPWLVREAMRLHPVDVTATPAGAPARNQELLQWQLRHRPEG
jgi:hypothetical protein